MALSKNEMVEIFSMLNAAYGNDKFSPTEETCNIWYDIIGDLPFDDAKEATRRFIRKSEFLPTIAGIMKEYDKIVEERNVIRGELNEWWDGVRSTYPKSSDDDLKIAREFYDRLTLNDPDRGNALYSKVCVDVRKAELNHTDLPNIQTYLEGVKTK